MQGWGNETGYANSRSVLSNNMVMPSCDLAPPCSRHRHIIIEHSPRICRTSFMQHVTQRLGHRRSIIRWPQMLYDSWPHSNSHFNKVDATALPFNTYVCNAPPTWPIICITCCVHGWQNRTSYANSRTHSHEYCDDMYWIRVALLMVLHLLSSDLHNSSTTCITQSIQLCNF